jgi:hypothetical protein
MPYAPMFCIGAAPTRPGIGAPDSEPRHALSETNRTSSCQTTPAPAVTVKPPAAPDVDVAKARHDHATGDTGANDVAATAGSSRPNRFAAASASVRAASGIRIAELGARRQAQGV